MKTDKQAMADYLSRKKVNFMKSAETYNLIIDSAEILIEESGINFFTMQNVAQKSGFGVGTIYLYFDNKESLFEGLVRRHMVNIFKKFQTHVINLLPLEPKDLLYNLFLIFLKDHKSKILIELFAMTSVLQSHKSGEAILSILLKNLELEIIESLKIDLDSNKIKGKAIILLHLLRGMLSVSFDQLKCSGGQALFDSHEEYAKWLTDFSFSFINDELGNKL